jgi:hypothetical protein
VVRDALSLDFTVVVANVSQRADSGGIGFDFKALLTFKQ